MSWFHNCSFKLISKTYSPGTRVSFKQGTDYMFQAAVEASKEKTSYLWECEDQNCRKTKVVILEGKEVPPLKG
jgi:hypothetical protein